MVPKVDTTLSTRRVLVTEYVAGRDFEAIKQLPQDERDRFAEIIFRFFYGLLMREHLASGDPHPGNYLLSDDGVTWAHLPVSKVSIDPVLGRIAFPPGTPPVNLRVTCQYGFSMPTGGGSYERSKTFALCQRPDCNSKRRHPY